MKICVPINEHSDVPALVEAGADEFYCGYLVSDGLLSNSGLSRHKGDKANFCSRERILTLREQIPHRCALHIVLNEHCFPKGYLRYVLRDIRFFLKAGIRRFIISDINLLLETRRLLPRVHLTGGTGMHIMNSGAVRFFRDLGIERIILPRHLRLKEIIAIINRFVDIEFEVFAKNVACSNIDGFCSYAHGDIGDQSFTAMCQELQFDDPRLLLNRDQGETACAACSMWDFLRSRNRGIHLKLVGRSVCYNKIIEKDVTYFRLLSGMGRISQKREFQSKARTLYRDIYGRDCQKNCYY